MIAALKIMARCNYLFFERDQRVVATQFVQLKG